MLGCLLRANATSIVCMFAIYGAVSIFQPDYHWNSAGGKGAIVGGVVLGWILTGIWGRLMQGHQQYQYANWGDANYLRRGDENSYVYSGGNYAKSDVEKAIAINDQAIALDPNCAINYIRRGFAQTVKGDLDKAMTDYNRAIALDPNSANAYCNRGTVYTKKGKLDKAIADLDQSVALDPNFTVAYLARGDAFYDMGNWDKTIADFQKAADLLKQEGDMSSYQKMLTMIENVRSK
jgi:tetratricopeptide (TPR) repeat protein